MPDQATTSSMHSQSKPDGESPSSVQVAVRVRPMLASEAGSSDCMDVIHSQHQGSSLERSCSNLIRIGGSTGPTFAFDETFSSRSTQSEVYTKRVAPLVRSCLDGYNATVVAYGQTGSGKTYTIMGENQESSSAGVIPRALQSLFAMLLETRQERAGDAPMNGGMDDDPVCGDHAVMTGAVYDYEVRVQFLELYGEEIRDLLAPQTQTTRLTIRDVGMDEPEVLGASQHTVHSAEEALLCLTRGMLRRVTAATAMNSSSSRSHAILSVMVEQTSTMMDEQDSTSQPRVEVKRSKFNFVDLAGSERQKRTQAEGKRLKEGIDINKGLLVLGNVISALGDPRKMGKTFVPYRDSKLTRLLKGSLGGNHKTLMIACVSPSSNNMEESLNCLRYANRAKNIQNNAIVNVDAGSRLLAELRGQIKALATDLLCVHEGRAQELSIPLETLKSLAAGREVLTGVGSRIQSTPIHSPAGIRQSSDIAGVMTEQSDLQDKMRLLESQKTSAVEALTATKVEREMYRLRLQLAIGDESERGDAETVFMKRAAAYEKEIAELKESLFVKTNVDIDKVMATPPRGRENSGFVIDKANRVLTEEKAHLVSLQKELAEGPAQKLSNERGLAGRVSPSVQLEAEEKAEHDELAAIARKYLPDEVETDDREGAPKIGSSGTDPAAVQREEKTAATVRHRQQMEVQLFEISRSIEAKEELIQQLQISQEKYATMREFYEEKLHQMEEQVNVRESEREALFQELRQMEESNSCTKDLQARLSAKEAHIAELRKKQRELVSLTKVSSRNESEIARLRGDVVHMKQKKVELQKLAASERKRHAIEIQRLKKESMQRDREATKWKRVSQQKSAEAERARMVSKTRLEQVGQLRLKYKEAEKKLRLKTIKRGVMDKAGLDPVLVGRAVRRKEDDSVVNYDAMRDYFDQKVAEVRRKEVIADKLALEWEEHLELVSQKEELATLVVETRSESMSEAVHALHVQLEYKEGRIRQLAKRLGKVQTSTTSPDSDSAELTFLGFKSLSAMCPGKAPSVVSYAAAKVLFGMVVRERRRVAALARAASSLDEKVLEAKKDADSKDAAFRSYVEDERREREALAQSQQGQILSLMAIVKEDEEILEASRVDPEKAEGESATQAPTSRSRVLLLANERIEILERQLEELKGEREAKDMYKANHQETQALLLAKAAECQQIEQQLNSLRASLRQIREASSQGNFLAQLSDDAMPSEENTLRKEIFSIAMEALHPSRSTETRLRKTHRPGPTSDLESGKGLLSPRLKRHVELMHTSDSEEDEEVPEWARDIMVDLAVIAKGETPLSIRDSPGVQAMESIPPSIQKTESNSVFDRLTHPNNFTGVQKQRGPRQRSMKSGPGAGGQTSGTKFAQVTSSQSSGRGRREAISRLVSESLENVVVPEGSEAGNKPSFMSPADTKEQDVTNGKLTESRSVFDRLLSPSNYTGTQKGRLQRTRAKMNRGVSNDEPDGLHDEDLAGDSEPADRISLFSNEQQKRLQSGSPTPARPVSKVADYTQQDVFERLQTTTTQSYVGKQHGPAMRPPAETRQSSATHDDESSPRLSIEAPPQGDANSDYTKQNVFERLQKTTTQAYAKKASKTLEN